MAHFTELGVSVARGLKPVQPQPLLLGKSIPKPQWKIRKTPGTGKLPEAALKGAHSQAKSYGGRWGKPEDNLFQIHSKAENTKHLGAIHRAVIKADDGGKIDAIPGSILAMKKAIGEQLKHNMRSQEGAKG